VAPLLATAVVDAKRLNDALLSGAARLQARGLSAPLPVDDATLVFDHRSGRRVRLRVDGSTVWSGNQPMAVADVRRAIQERPGAFSGNVALRPVLQGALLPCISYVGGPAEIAYYHQLPELFAALEVPCPVLVPRLSATIVPSPLTPVLAELGADLGEAVRRPSTLLDRLAQHPGSPEIAARQTQLRREIDEFATLSAQGHANLKRPAARARRTMERALDRLARQASVGNLPWPQGSAPRLDAILAWLHPRGKLQERVLSPAGLVVEYGATRLLNTLAHEDPRAARHLIIEL
jgi:uncharacterized protein YllA (UPF0747 family)